MANTVSLKDLFPPGSGASVTTPSGTLRPPLSVAATAAAGGAPAAPASPLGASTLSPSITPSQAKMAGTPAQAQSTVSLGGVSTPPPPAPPQSGAATLADAMRAAGAGGETVSAPTAQDIENRNRVDEARATGGDFAAAAERLVQSYLPGGANAPKAAGPVYTVDTAAATQAGLTPQATAALTAYAADPTNQDKLAAAQSASGLAPDKIQALLHVQTTEEAAAAATPQVDALKLDDPTLAKLGMSRDRVAALFPPGTDISTKSVADVRAAVEAMVSSARDPVSQLQAQLTNPLLGPQERDAAAQQLLARGATVHATEEEANKLEADINSGLKISLDGKDYTVEDLLDSAQSSSLIHRLLTEPADSPFRAEMAQKLPDLVSWVDKHEVALSAAASALSDTAKGVTEGQAAVQQTYQNLTSGPMALTDNEIGAIFGDNALRSLKDPYSLHAPDLKGNGLAQLVLDPAKAGVVDPAGLLARMRGLPPDLQSQLGAFSVDDLKKIGFTDGSQTWTDFLAARQANAQFNAAGLTPEQRIQAYLGADFSMGTAQDWLTKVENAAKVTGDDTGLKDIQNLFDSNHNGTIDDAATIASRLRDEMGSTPPTLQTLLAGKIPHLPDAVANRQAAPELAAGQDFLVEMAGREGNPQSQAVGLDYALAQPADGPARQLSWDDLPHDLSKGVWSHLAPDSVKKLQQLLDSNAQISVNDSLGGMRRPDGGLFRLPFAVYSEAGQRAHGQEPADPATAGAALSKTDYEELDKTLVAMNDMDPPKADSDGFPHAEWDAMKDRAGTMIKAYTDAHPEAPPPLSGDKYGTHGNIAGRLAASPTATAIKHGAAAVGQGVETQVTAPLVRTGGSLASMFHG